MDVKTPAIDLSDDKYFFLTEDGGVHLQGRTVGIITLTKKELDKLKKLTKTTKSLEVLYGKR